MPDPFSALFHLDVQTVLVLLFAGNLALGCLILLFQGIARESTHHLALRTYALARLMQSLGWLFVLEREHLPEPLGVLAADNLLVLGFFLESLVALDLAAIRRPGARWAHIGVTGAALTVMNAVLLTHPTPAVRVAAATFGVAGSLLTPSLLFFLDRLESPFRRILGAGNLLFLAVLGARTATGLVSGEPGLGIAGLTQGLTFLVLILMLVLSGAVVLLIAKEDADRELREMAVKDPLTGLSNRRAFIHQASRVLAYHWRYGLDASMLFIDIDHFKAINDQFGHAAGDAVIVHLAGVLRQSIREFDLHCRYGGEEFVLLLPNSSEEEALAVAGRIREGVAHREDGVLPAAYTVSVGVASRLEDPADPLEDLLRRSDAALYRAKQAGRDRVEVHAPIAGAQSA